ncbi:uncharacterized protein LOC125419100 isoform X4 [Ziziphus jujuba]|uniref:Uncharacterized protein LOC125419100 isoform X4 n=1 Tax=Ziziphus jujuba TaxID=326968 RepID=A0ABM3I453_ZIZJJ|nr:uncharacterized protein LOC125419100 isoform X4 [Ziziphus jujuba]
MFSKLNLPIFAGFLFFWRVVFGGVELVAVNSHLVFTIQFLNSEVNEVRISIPSWKRKRLAWRSIYHMVPQQQKGGLATGALQRLVQSQLMGMILPRIQKNGSNFGLHHHHHVHATCLIYTILHCLQYLL